jgi:hypothetical protein
MVFELNQLESDMRTFCRKSYEIVGWTYEAAVHCNDCAAVRFGTSQDKHTDSGRSLQGVDGEGNDIHPLFLDNLSDFDYVVSCDGCFKPIE